VGAQHRGEFIPREGDEVPAGLRVLEDQGACPVVGPVTDAFEDTLGGPSG